MNILNKLRLNFKKFAVFFALFFYFILPISVANAGVFSFFGDLFNTNTTHLKYTNSQTATILQAATNPDPNPSKGGGDITIIGNSALLPESGPSGTISNINNESSQKTKQISVYVVRKGDSLSQIAKMFDISVDTIVWENDIKKGNVIKIGQILVILPVSGIEYTIKRKDTINGIAKKYKAKTKDILAFNNISNSSNLKVGKMIIIPGGKKASTRYRSNKKYSVRIAEPVHDTKVPSYRGYYIRPIAGGRNSRATSKNPHGLHGYNAVDLAVRAGTPIVASASGVVIISKNSGWNWGYGRYVMIKHPNNTKTLYAHSSKVIVKRGQYVRQGQVIAYIGSTGNSTGPHVHFEIRGARNPF